MTEDRSLLAALEVLRVGLGAYLQWLRRLWADDPARPEAQRLLDAAGRRPQPTATERAAGVAAVQALEQVDGGALPALSWALNLGIGDLLLVAAAWWAEVDPQLGAAIGCAHDDAARHRPSAGLIRLVLAPYGIDAPLAVDDRHPLVSRGVVAGATGPSEPVVLTPTALAVLAGRMPVPLEAPEPPPRLAPLRAALVRRLAARGDDVAVTVLRGAAGSGRRALVAAAAGDAGLVAVAADRPVPELRLLARLGVAVPVAGAGEEAEAAWSAGDGPLVVLAPPRHRSAQAAALVVDVAGPDVAARAARWAAALDALDDAGAGGLADEPALVADLARRFRFTEPAIDATVARAARRARWSDRAATAADLWEAARRQPEHDLDRLATLITPVWTLDDLVVPGRVRDQLDELLAHVSHQDEVLDRWGFRRRLPRGQGVAALFSGPSGTGKTMAAEAVAHALHEDLYRVDLAAVVSKWLGETEKNLAAAFDEAERSGAVLLFDEADALFGKRTEVHDSHDRYANLEVNYLLQRVEAFTGLVILATNRRSSLDEAFVRRLRFMIGFEMPGPADRRRLWPQSFPAEAPRDDLDWDALAAGELAGASIQAVALSAAFLAASDGGAITATHVEAALGREYEKLGRAFPGLPPASAAARSRP
ncbi:MAG TPA: ATP-binding protein [Acidimicrobiales bacterium]|nr:ATP-binding protein [Acidimicrobiales bacterium]